MARRYIKPDLCCFVCWLRRRSLTGATLAERLANSRLATVEYSDASATSVNGGRIRRRRAAQQAFPRPCVFVAFQTHTSTKHPPPVPIRRNQQIPTGSKKKHMHYESQQSKIWRTFVVRGACNYKHVTG